MTDGASTPLAPDELLRVMDAVEVVRQRRQALERHEAFDRDAAVREIQVVFEELGELVDADVIGEALDDYEAERYAFRPHTKGPSSALAWLYIRRGVVTRRVLAPAFAIAAGGWLVLGAVDALQRRSLENQVRSLAVEVEAAIDEHAEQYATIERLRRSSTVAELPSEEAAAFAEELTTAERALDGVAGVLEARLSPVDWPAQPSVDVRRRIRSDLDLVRGGMTESLVGIASAQRRLVTQEELVSLGREAAILPAAIVDISEEADPRSLAAELRQAAERAMDLRDLEALRGPVARMRQLLEVLGREFEVVVTGGVWRRHDDNPNVRNHYLIVRATDSAGRPVSLPIRNEETGRTEVVSEWAERVPEDVYDRVAADKQDNEIIDDDAFGTKRRGYVDMQRRYPDVGQITRW